MSYKALCVICDTEFDTTQKQTKTCSAYCRLLLAQMKTNIEGARKVYQDRRTQTDAYNLFVSLKKTQVKK